MLLGSYAHLLPHGRSFVSPSVVGVVVGGGGGIDRAWHVVVMLGGGLRAGLVNRS
jgi:hypothetical protein